MPGLGDLPSVARAPESARVAFVLLGLAAASEDTGFTSEPVICSRKAASGLATLPVLLGHLESQLPARPTLWNRPGKPPQTFIGSQPGMIEEMFLTRPAFGWHLFGHCSFPQIFLTKSL